MVSSRLSQHLEVKLVSDGKTPGSAAPSGGGAGKDSAPSVLPANETLASYVMQHDTSRALKVIQV